MDMLSAIHVQTWIYAILIVVYAITVISCIVVVLSENRNPIKSLAWVTVLLFLPVAGLVFYLFFGRNPKSHHRLSRHNKRKLLHRVTMRTVPASELNISEENRQIVKLSETVSDTPVTVGNDIRVFTEGAPKFATLKRDLRAARRFILLQYYIFNDDKIGNEIADILIERARAGVSVRVIYDHVGFRSLQEVLPAHEGGGHRHATVPACDLSAAGQPTQLAQPPQDSGDRRRDGLHRGHEHSRPLRGAAQG